MGTVMRLMGILLVVLAGCEEARWSKVRSPDGNHWWIVVSCSDGMARCYDDAREACHGSYEIVDRDEKGSRSVAGAWGTKNVAFAVGRSDNEHEMMVECGSTAAVEREETVTRPPPPAAPAPDLTVCSKDYEHIGDLAEWWEGRSPDAPALDRTPTRAEFLSLCGELSEAVQLCLNRAYESTHEETCAQPLARSTKALNSLFLADGVKR